MTSTIDICTKHLEENKQHSIIFVLQAKKSLLMAAAGNRTMTSVACINNKNTNGVHTIDTILYHLKFKKHNASDTRKQVNAISTTR